MDDLTNVIILISQILLSQLFPGSCVRLLSAIACELDLDVLCHFDVDQAFVQSKPDKDVFLRCLSKRCGSLSGKILRLKRSRYVLKQASRLWHAHPTSCLKTLGFE